jgi:transcription elongation GreA/GreB family factor
MLNKSIVHSALLQELDNKLLTLTNLLQETLQSTAVETKSSAGDKHETGRSMAQLEQEKIGRQLTEMHRLKKHALKIDPSTNHSLVTAGSLVHTSTGWYYLSVGTGKITIQDQSVFCMTAATPFGQQLTNKKAGDIIHWMGTEVTILTVY